MPSSAKRSCCRRTNAYASYSRNSGANRPAEGAERRIVAGQAPAFDPYEQLAALQRHHVSFVVIGAFARVIHGTAELTEGMDITPSMREDNVARLKNGLDDLEAKRRDRKRLDLHTLDDPVVALRHPRRRADLIPTPAGTRGYDDLRRHASRESLGQGLRPQVASPGDLARMLGALDRPERPADPAPPAPPDRTRTRTQPRLDPRTLTPPRTHARRAAYSNYSPR